MWSSPERSGLGSAAAARPASGSAASAPALPIRNCLRETRLVSIGGAPSRSSYGSTDRRMPPAGAPAYRSTLWPRRDRLLPSGESRARATRAEDPPVACPSGSSFCLESVQGQLGTADRTDVSGLVLSPHAVLEGADELRRRLPAEVAVLRLRRRHERARERLDHP